MKALPMIALSVGLSLGAQGAMAEYQPRPGQHDPRVRQASYQDGQIYRLHVTLGHVTSIEFGEGEVIQSIIAGDTEGFQLQSVPGDRAVAIKPMASGVTTNMTVYTNRRSYYFHVTESSQPTHYVIRFHYPGERAHPTNAVTRRASNQSYGVTDPNSSITPNAIWDDGTFTYFRFRRNAPVPAIFLWSDGRERTVNSTAAGDGVIRVSGVSDRWVLRLGDTEVCVEDLNRARRVGA